MFFLDELKDYKLYRRTVLLPINEKDKRRTCAAFLLSPNEKGVEDILHHSLLVGRYYNGYYTERAVLYYINQEGAAEPFEGEYITEKVSLYEPNEFKIHYSGYDHFVGDAKKALSKKWIEKICDYYRIDIKKLKDCEIVVDRSGDTTDRDTIHLSPNNKKIEKDFGKYAHYCRFNFLMWLFYQVNPGINDWLCMACALRESGVAAKYNKSDWPFNFNLGVVCRSLDNYVKENSEREYIKNIIKGYNGKDQLGVTVGDMVSLLSKDIQKEINPLIFGESLQISNEMGVLLEDKKYNAALRKILYNDRLKSIKDLKAVYEKIKGKYSDIKYTYNNLDLYRTLNLYIDLTSYNRSFVANSNFKKVKAATIYTDMISRLINDPRIKSAGYNTQTVIIPVMEWTKGQDLASIHLVGKYTTPISCIYWMLKGNGPDIKSVFGDREVLFLGKSSFMKINFSKAEIKPDIFLRNIRHIAQNKIVVDPEANAGGEQISSARAIKMAVVDNIEAHRKIKIDDISVEDEPAKEPKKTTVKNVEKEVDTKQQDNTEEKRQEELKKELVKNIDKASKNKTNIDDTLDSIDNNPEDAERFRKIISDLSSNPDNGGSNISGARASRMLKLQNDFMDSEFEGRTIRDIVNTDESNDIKVEPVKLNIDSVNPEWKNLQFAANLDSYNLDNDIVRMFSCFWDHSNPLAVRDINKEDTSTSDDLIETYTCRYESARGERFTIKLDIPKFVDNKYMILRGNRKNIPIQLFLMPIIKTEDNAVQIVSCYNKIFVRRFGTTSGKSNPISDKLLKTLTKKEYKHIKVSTGDNTRVCAKYELPIDYIDLAANFSKIETPQYVFMFNQDEIRSKLKVDDKNGMCFGYDKKSKNPIYYKPNPNEPIFFSQWLFTMIETSLANTNERDIFIEDFNNAATSIRYTYSRASILGTNIPLVVICGLAVGLERTMKLAKFKYNLSEKRPKIDYSTQDIIRFKDGYLTYDLNYASCLLMNGLKQCNTEDYSLGDINTRLMYLDFLDMFGGRIKADGLDNFQDCMIDPITKETLQHYKLPTDYVSVLLYSNFLLSDNKFVKHGDIRSTRRLRRTEQVASYLYEVLSKAYGAYSTGLKHGRAVGFSVKQSAVIDRLLVGNTTDDQSILNALGEYEAYYTVTPKGPSGMNSDRAYSLDKRSFDESMMGVLSASTGFAGNVGISRQATIDANIDGARGYIYNDPNTQKDEINSVKTLCMTEALCPYSSTRDDPMRLAMGFIQTQKHGMRCDHSDPLLITSGADEALPHLISNTFAYKSKEAGEVVELTDDYMIIKYNREIVDYTSGKKTQYEYINLKEEVQKNSSSGFYVTLKLDTDLKVGKKFKKGDILAYDKGSFSNNVGADDNIAYNIGTLAKFAILNTDEGYEDSAIVSDTLSEQMASDIVLEKEITIPKEASVYDLVKKGQKITEGDTLMILQNSYDDEDVNVLLRNLSGDEDEVTDLGRIPIKSKVTGVVQDIIIERTVDISELSPSLKTIVKKYEGDINARKKIMKKYGIEDENKILPDTETMPAIGRLKKAQDSVVIRIYLKYHDKFSVGCKLIYGTAVKGVCKDIFPKGLEPYSQYRPNEMIHSLLSIGSINARMVTSELITAGINKGLIELSRKVKDMAGIKWKDNLIE